MIIAKGKLIAFDEPQNLEKKLLTQNEIIITSDATEAETRKTLDTVGYISEVSVSCKDGLTTAHIKTEHKDIYEVSRQIFYAFSYEGQALLEMTLKKASLEDVFIELTEGGAPADMPHDADNSNSETETYLADSEVTDK